MTSIGDRIRLLMHFKKLNATQLAEIIDVQRSSISHILTGRNKPSLDFVQRVVKEFPEVSYDWLLNGTGKLNKAPSSKSSMTAVAEVPAPKDSDTIVTFRTNNPVTDVSDSDLEKVTPVTETPSQENLSTEPKQMTSGKDQKTNTLPQVVKVIIFYNDGSYQEIKQ